MICSFSYVANELKPKIRKLRKLKKFRLSKDELNWLLEQNVYADLEHLSRGDFVMFGEEANKECNVISDYLAVYVSSDSPDCLGNIKHIKDRYGLFSEILQIREKNSRIKITRKNLGHKESAIKN